jgi:hypothetical protein
MEPIVSPLQVNYNTSSSMYSSLHTRLFKQQNSPSFLIQHFTHLTLYSVSTSPGLVKAHPGDDADLRWILTEESSVHDVYHTSFNSGNELMQQFWPGDPYFLGSCAGRCSSLVESLRSGIRIPNVATSDARKYILDLPLLAIHDDNAILYILRKFREKFFHNLIAIL